MSVTPHALSLSTHSTVCTQGCVTAYAQGCVCSQPVGFQPPWTLPDHFASHACQGTPANTAATPASKQTSPRQALHTQHFGSMLYTTECPVCYSIHVVTTLNICAHSNCPQAANCHIQGAEQLGSAAYTQHTQAPIVNKPLMQSRMQLFPAHHTSPDGCDWYKAMRRLQITHSLFGRQPSHTGHARLSPHVVVTTHPVATDGSAAWSRIDSTAPGANTCQHTNHYLMAMEAANISAHRPRRIPTLRWKSGGNQCW